MMIGNAFNLAAFITQVYDEIPNHQYVEMEDDGFVDSATENLWLTKLSWNYKYSPKRAAEILYRAFSFHKIRW